MKTNFQRTLSFLRNRANIYDALNLLPTLTARATAFLLRRPFNPATTNSREGVYARAQERYDYIVQGGELVNRAPPLPGDPLLYVQPEDHADLTSLGAIQRKGKWYMPEGTDEESQWKFAKWFAKATPDLEIKGTTWNLTRDGRSTNGYILPEDLYRGGDSTATSLVMGAFPVILALGLVLNMFSTLLALAVCLPLLALHAITIYQCEDASTLFKVLGLSVALPVLMTGLLVPIPDHTSGMKNIMVLGGAVFVMSFWASRSTTGKAGTATHSLFTRFKHSFAITIFVMAVNMGLSLLPQSLSFIKPLGWFMVACAYPLYYTWGNFRQRTAELELQSKQRAGSMSQNATATGWNAPARMQQIRNAARDNSPLVPLARAQGYTKATELPCAPEAGQVMSLSRQDFSTHMFVLGETGAGKTGNFLRWVALCMKTLKEKVGAIITDGKGAMAEDMRPALDIVIEPGIKLNPIQGMDAQMVANALAEANGSDSMDESIWQDGANAFHRFAWAIHEALVEHEKATKADTEAMLESLELQVDHLLMDREIARRAGQDTSFMSSILDQKMVAIDRAKEFIASTRQYRWTMGGYSKTKDTLAYPVMMSGGLMRASDEALEIFDFLGYPPIELLGETPSKFAERQAAYQDRLLNRPNSIHPHLRDPAAGRVLARAIHFAAVIWPNTDEKQRSSFLINVDRDILGFMQSDELRGSLIDGVDHGEQAWADTEEGVDIMQVLYGAWLGINLPEGHTSKVITKLIKYRLFKEIGLRPKKYGERWQQKSGQVPVMDMSDECQELVSPMEINMVAMARSIGLFYVYATQEYESLETVMKTDEARNRFLNKFLSLAVFRTSERTYQYVKSRLGKTKRLRVHVQPQAFMDVSRAIDTRHNTIYGDPNHPSAHVLKDLERRGSTRFQPVVNGLQPYQGLARKVPLEALADQNYIPVHMSGKFENLDVLEDWELNDKLGVSGTVALILNRAQQKRVDFCNTRYWSVSDFEAELAARRANTTET